VVEVEGVELAELEGLEAIEDEGLGDGGGGWMGFEEEQAVSGESFDVSGDGGGGGVELPGDLSVGGAGEDAPEGGQEELGASEVVVDAEGL
jgi:hypothetical protein